jgi:hypothetical protein
MRTRQKTIIDITAYHESDTPMIEAFARVYALVIEDGRRREKHSAHLLYGEPDCNLKSSERRYLA